MAVLSRVELVRHLEAGRETVTLVSTPFHESALAAYRKEQGTRKAISMFPFVALWRGDELVETTEPGLRLQGDRLVFERDTFIQVGEGRMLLLSVADGRATVEVWTSDDAPRMLTFAKLELGGGR